MQKARKRTNPTTARNTQTPANHPPRKKPQRRPPVARRPSPDTGEVVADYRTLTPQDGSPSWPTHPFSEESQRVEYKNWGYYPPLSVELPATGAIVGRQTDSRQRFFPTQGDVAAFYRWNTDFNPYGPDWHYWLTHLMQFNQLTKSQCRELHCQDIITFLDATGKPDEVASASAALRAMAVNLAVADHIEIKCESDGTNDQQITPVIHRIRHRAMEITGSLLLKTHGLPDPFQRLGRFVFCVENERFIRSLVEALDFPVSPDRDPHRSELVRQLAIRIGDAAGVPQPLLVVFCGTRSVLLQNDIFDLPIDQIKLLACLIGKNGEYLHPADYDKDVRRIIQGRSDRRNHPGMPYPLRHLIDARQKCGHRLKVKGEVVGRI